MGGEGHRRCRKPHKAAHAADLDVTGVVDPEAASRDDRFQMAHLGVKCGRRTTDLRNGLQDRRAGRDVARASKVGNALRRLDRDDAAGGGGDHADSRIALDRERHPGGRCGGSDDVQAAQRLDEHAARARVGVQRHRLTIPGGADQEEVVRCTDPGAGVQADGLGRNVCLV